MRVLRIASDAVGYGILAGALILVLVKPEVGNTVVIAGMIGAIVIGVLLRQTETSLRHPVNALPLAALVLLVIACAVTATSWGHVAVALLLAVFSLTGPVTALFVRLGGRMSAGLVGLLGLIGTLLGTAIAAYDYYVAGIERAGDSINNPIHFGGLALTIGFMALAGAFSPNALLRYLCLLAPVLAIVTVMLTGSRGPLVAAVPLAIAMAVLAIAWGRPSLKELAVGAAVVIAGLGAALLVFLLTTGDSLTARLMPLLDLANTADQGIRPRLEIYEAAYHAFIASPLYGHGILGFVEAASQFPPRNGVAIGYDHLHSDLADFAVAGGLLGIGAYLLLLLAPLAEALRAPQGRNRRVAIILATTLSVGYAAMGVSNAMFGILSQSLLYAAGMALVAYFARTPDRSLAAD